MSKIIALLMAVTLLLSVTVVPVFAEGTANLSEKYGEETEIIEDEVEIPIEAPMTTVAEKKPEKPAETAPVKKEPAVTAKPAETKPSIPAVTEPPEEQTPVPSEP